MSAEEDDDCPLCLLPLRSYDRSHPLQCPSRHCHFNCCMDCLDRMIKSSKDVSTEASDGNTFRVFLHCPNCRSNLGPSIRDTLLLRKVDIFSQPSTDDGGGHGLEVVDERLPASELRLKYALKRDEDIAYAVEDAKCRENYFFGRRMVGGDGHGEMGAITTGGGGGGNNNNNNFGIQGGSSSVWSFEDEGRDEVDYWPSSSFVVSPPRHHPGGDERDENNDPKQQRLDIVRADSTLLCGLDVFMTEQEQQFITAQLISGDPSRLAAATEMMFYVSALSKQGIRPSSLQRSSSNNSIGNSGRKKSSSSRSMLESIKAVIREGNEARRLEEEKKEEAIRRRDVAKPPLLSRARAKTTGLVGGGGSAGRRRNQKRLVDLETKRRLAYMELRPLPLRMPKYAEITASTAETMDLTFLDNSWDGTVLDAFTKINVNTSLLGHVTATKHYAESSGIRRVINAGGGTSKPPNKSHDNKGHVGKERPRVIVASINQVLGQHGIVNGDVVTHFNGEEFWGTAGELAALLKNRYEGEVLTLVFNADIAVAEALKRRSMIPTNSIRPGGLTRPGLMRRGHTA